MIEEASIIIQFGFVLYNIKDCQDMTVLELSNISNQECIKESTQEHIYSSMAGMF